MNAFVFHFEGWGWQWLFVTVMGTLNGIIQSILPLSLQLYLILLALAEKFRPLHISGLF